MKMTEVTMVRIYCTEAKHQLEPLLALLHDQHKVAGVTAFRGIAGFGRSGRLHTSSLLDMSLDLPLIIEFFDRPARVAEVMEHLKTMVDPGHIVSWAAEANLEQE